MKVTIGDRVYLIEFAYTVRPASNGHAYDANEITICRICDGSAPREPKTPAPILANGQAVRYFKDPPNREIGRKAALTDALFNLDMIHGSVFGGVSKARRRAFWTVYLNRKKKQPTKLDGLIAELAVQEMVHSTKP